MIQQYKINKDISLRDYLKSFYISSSKIYILINEKRVFINDIIAKENDNLVNGDILKIDFKEELDYKPENKKINIIYEDDYFLIINKEPGMIIHNDDKNKTGSLCNYVANYYKNTNQNIPVLFAHRLDIETSGLIIFCKDLLTLGYMNHYIETHDIARVYLALVNNKFKDNNGTISLSIGDDRHNAKRKRVSETGKAAVTHYEVLKEFKNYSLVKLILETGRTHQIRVHMSYLNHSLLGDKLYGKPDSFNRCMLHSYYVTFIHPITNEKMTIYANIPNDMKALGVNL